MNICEIYISAWLFTTIISIGTVAGLALCFFRSQKLALEVIRENEELKRELEERRGSFL
jgi:hypothetical protein